MLVVLVVVRGDGAAGAIVWLAWLCFVVLIPVVIVVAFIIVVLFVVAAAVVVPAQSPKSSMKACYSIFEF